MKKLLMIVCLLSCVTHCFAKVGGEGNNTNCNGVGNANSPCNPTDNPPPQESGGDIYNSMSSQMSNTNVSSNTNIASNTNLIGVSNENNNASASNSSSSVVSSNTSSSTATGGNNNNVNNASGGSTSINMPRQAPPAVAPNMSAQGNNSFSGGISTPFGGLSLGTSRVDGSVRALNRAMADNLLVESMLSVQECTSDECVAFKKYLLKRFK
jgi:hypothetical protein